MSDETETLRSLFSENTYRCVEFTLTLEVWDRWAFLYLEPRKAQMYVITKKIEAKNHAVYLGNRVASI